MLNVKIVGAEGDSILVKYTSENSKKNIDEYDAVAYQPGAQGYTDIAAFLDAMKDSMYQQVVQRDNIEKAAETVDLSQWVGHESTETIVPVVPPTNPNEVIL